MVLCYWDTYDIMMGVCFELKTVVFRHHSKCKLINLFLEVGMAAQIVGRIVEKRVLEQAYQSPRAEFIGVYGRRRVGKTYLIRNFFQAKECVYFQTTGIYKGKKSAQLSKFMQALGDTFYRGAAMKEVADWPEAFHALTQAIKQEPAQTPIVLFFDELSWMATARSGFIGALEYYWNQYWEMDPRIKLVVCGSAAAWIIKKIINNHGGLHNRITKKIHLQAFNLAETLLYLKSLEYPCDLATTLKLYMVMGGVPFYLNNLDKSESVEQNIDRLFFNEHGVFFNEFEEIFSSLFDDSDQYQEIVTFIATQCEGVSYAQIAAANPDIVTGGRLTQRLQDLEYTGFINSLIPYGHKKYGVIYKISDPYCYFYLRWIKNNKFALKQNSGVQYWKTQMETPDYLSWKNYAFENACYKHFLAIKKALRICMGSLGFPWRYVAKKGGAEQGAQIDLLFDRTDRAITICEIQYAESGFSIDKDYAEKLLTKIEVFKKITRTKKQIFLAMIASHGLRETRYTGLVNQTVTLEALFAQAE